MPGSRLNTGVTVSTTTLSLQAGSKLPSEHDGFAIASLVTAFFLPILGIIFGHLSNHRAKLAHRAESGLAVAGLVLGYLFTVISVLVIIIVAAASSTPAASMTPAPPARSAPSNIANPDPVNPAPSSPAPATHHAPASHPVTLPPATHAPAATRAPAPHAPAPYRAAAPHRTNAPRPAASQSASAAAGRYRAGEYCSVHGSHTTDSHGRLLTCAYKNGWRWEH
jgi:peptidyl-prolyl cis-trans isomerase B (cyclophilin B)